MMETKGLSGHDLVRLVDRVFAPRAEDGALAILVDLPDGERPDRPLWRARRELARDWAKALSSVSPRSAFTTDIVLYRNAGQNNGPLPESAWVWADPSKPLPDDAATLARTVATTPFSEIFKCYTMFLAPTELSATAPLKLAAREYGFRAATMPGFRVEMIPALHIDYGEVNRRVLRLKELLDAATRATVRFQVGDREYSFRMDLRNRLAHASGGLLRNPGEAGNLPSGEAYIVPYEGERAGEPSLTAGELPVEFEDGLVIYRVEENRAIEVSGEEPAASRERERLARDPAYGNISELGLGVLSDMGVLPVGEVLLDEKLGLHIAFGRSDHFGGQVGVADFSSPAAAVHIDRVYLPALQPRIHVTEVVLTREAEPKELVLMRDGEYVS